MNNYKIVESLAKTSGFNQHASKDFLEKLVSNTKSDANHYDHLSIRAKIANLNDFADAQEVSDFGL